MFAEIIFFNTLIVVDMRRHFERIRVNLSDDSTIVMRIHGGAALWNSKLQ